MEYQHFIDELRALLASEDLLEINQHVNDLRSNYENYVLEQERLHQIATLDAQEQGQEAPELPHDFGKEEFYALIDQYREAKKKIQDEKSDVETKNLKEKQQLIARLKAVITDEENIGAAFAAFKEIQETWKTIGDIPRKNRNEIQSEYSKLIEDFFYNIHIYKELKDHDFHRNKQLKEALIEKLKGLRTETSVKELEHQLKAIQNDWEDIGPVPNEEWEGLKDSYWTEVRSMYNRINRFYEDKRSEQKENITKKEGLIKAAEEILQQVPNLETAKQWEVATDSLLTIQTNWKTIGFGPKKENDEVWKKFRSVCDAFFAAKKAFGSVAQKEFDAVAEKKKLLIDQALAMKDSTDWKNTSEKFIRLQKEWNAVGNAGKKHEQKLWKQFRAACDDFFSAKQKHFSEKDHEFEANLEVKKALIEEIKSLQLATDKNEALEQLRTLSARFASAGLVPLKEKERIFKQFKDAMDAHYQALNLEGKEKDAAMFRAKIDTLSASPHASKQMAGMKQDLRREIDDLKREILQLENNLGFFARSKGADALRAEVEKKIEAANRKIDQAKQRLKMIPNE